VRIGVRAPLPGLLGCALLVRLHGRVTRRQLA
jgi:hypothetical protein